MALGPDPVETGGTLATLQSTGSSVPRLRSGLEPGRVLAWSVSARRPRSGHRATQTVGRRLSPRSSTSADAADQNGPSRRHIALFRQNADLAAERHQIASASTPVHRHDRDRFVVLGAAECAPPPLSIPPASGADVPDRSDRRERREWDSNPRWVAPHTLSKRADSAALASLPDVTGQPPGLPGWTKGSGGPARCRRSAPPIRLPVAKAVDAAPVLLRGPAAPAIAPKQRCDVLAGRRRRTVVDQALGSE